MIEKNIEFLVKDRGKRLEVIVKLPVRETLEENQIFFHTSDILEYVTQRAEFADYKLVDLTHSVISNSQRGDYVQEGIWFFEKKTIQARSTKTTRTRTTKATTPKSSIRTRTRKLAAAAKQKTTKNTKSKK